MNKILFLLPILIFTTYADALSFESRVTAGQSWNDSAGFPSTYERLAKTTIAEIIEKKRGGYYDGWDQTNYYFSNTAIGAQTNFYNSDLENVQVNTANCGNASGTTSLQSAGETETFNSAGPCRIENSNATTP